MLYLNLKVLGKHTLWFSNYAFLLKENSEEYKKDRHTGAITTGLFIVTKIWK